MQKIKSYWWTGNNFGDKVSPIITGHFTGKEIVPAGREEKGKLLGLGSILSVLRENDVVWGSGTNRRNPIEKPPGAQILALRGPLTRGLMGDDAPEVYGDPGILLPLIYQPEIEKTHAIGIVPHYVDKKIVLEKYADRDVKIIDIQADWKKVIEDILSCEKIIASTLHGIICAEAYGITAQWAVWSDKILGGELKYQDYFLGSGRARQELLQDIPLIENLKDKQDVLINALKIWSDQIV
jgi:pyruvyltransferase